MGGDEVEKLYSVVNNVTDQASAAKISYQRGICGMTNCAIIVNYKEME